MATHRHPQKILIIRLSSIGDILLSTPLLRILKTKFPDAHIDFLVKKQFIDTIRTNPHIDKIYTLDSTLGRSELHRLSREFQNNAYDVVLDIHDNFRSKALRKKLGAKIGIIKKYKWKRFLLVSLKINRYQKITPVYKRYIDAANFLNIQDDNWGPEFHLDHLEHGGVLKYLSALGYRTDHKTIGIVPGAGFPNKQYPLDKTIAVIDKLAEQQNIQFLLLGSRSERSLTNTITQAVTAPCINLAGEMTLMQTACAIDLCDVLLTNDSGMMHLANALHKKTVSVFGPTVRELGFFPFGNKAIVLENKDLVCRPCTHMGRKNCPKKHFKCMQDIAADEVYAALQSLLTDPDV